MVMNNKLLLASALVFFAAIRPNTFAADKSATKEIGVAAKKFLATLDDTQRGKVVYEFKDDAQRKRWSNLPTGAVQRGGLRMGDLTKPEREAAMAVLAAALSPNGYEKVAQIVEADELLKTSGGRMT